MNFAEFIASDRVAIAEGAVLERVRRDPALTLDPNILNGGFIYDPIGRARLAEIHNDYIRVARKAGMPVFTFTDTWRCSQSAIKASRFSGKPVNEDNFQFLRDLRTQFGKGSPIFIGGLVGPSGDAYKPADSLGRGAAREFHWPQIESLASAGVDFLHLATAPNVDEALGVADAMSETGLPYLISLVVRRTGVVLDGTSIGEAISRIDSGAIRAPTGYSINCVHASALQTALQVLEADHSGARRRLLTFQGNTADCEVEELDGLKDLVTELAAIFAENLVSLRDRFGLRVLGGCCGTEGAHIKALANRLACEAKTAPN